MKRTGVIGPDESETQEENSGSHGDDADDVLEEEEWRENMQDSRPVPPSFDDDDTGLILNFCSVEEIEE